MNLQMYLSQTQNISTTMADSRQLASTFLHPTVPRIREWRNAETHDIHRVSLKVQVKLFDY